ncbi:Zinc finger protein like 1 [Paragonimus heterotremus]|uniref:Zinc finger protein like 1 n=1 Tax=Paragonimus heterotremus TaxID=100268 RepID=A0A8J4SZI8_9TREM|nr:Zinc finger protein like 1 [Paragonimus heterotremus]
MGLCKCERRRVTTLFCFEHRVNVCEFCLVSSHEKCIVKSYLRWLKDSNFDPSCGICHERFDESDKKCVRLVCLDVFHRDCLNQLVLSAPPTTAPAGYVCPSCGHPIIPCSNQGGPVAEALRNVLSDVDWAKCEFTGPNSRSQPSLPNRFDASLPLNTSGYINSIATLTGNEKLLDPHLDRVARQFLSGQDVPVTEFRTPIVQADTSANYPPNHDPMFQPSPTALRRDAPINVNSVSAYPNRPDDEDKYKRRFAFNGLIRTFNKLSDRATETEEHRKGL